MQLKTVLLCLFGAAPFFTSASAPYSEYILAPSSRTLIPKAIRRINGTVTNASGLINNNSTTQLAGANSSITLDFGRNVAGTVHFRINSTSGSDEYIGFSFTESSMWIGDKCDATLDQGLDEPLWFPISRSGTYAAPKERQRGGFRYLSVLHNTTGTVSLSQLTVNWTASPDMANPMDYAGYFHSDSEKLNRVWYAGAYTNQLCSIDANTGNAILNNTLGYWVYDYPITNGTAALVDGAKRDRVVWPGDIAISQPSLFVSTGRLESLRNGLDSLWAIQQSDGRLAYSGVPFQSLVPASFQWSFTYHLHTLGDLYDYYMFTGDLDYLRTNWNHFKLGISYVLNFIDDTGLANVTSSRDWLRSGMGGHNIEANSILYRTLNLGVTLASVLNDNSTEIANWSTTASSIKEAANSRLWDASQNLFYDNDTTTSLHPQDGNAWAIYSSLVNPTRAALISTALASRWIHPYGAPAPEAGATISPFASGFEVQAHYLAGFPERAEELMEFMFADFMLDDPRMTNSTFIEGYSTDGGLHYAPYANDARVSHAHGWSTGPTSALTFLGAGIRIVEAGGGKWLMKPLLGKSNRIAAGYRTRLGRFAASWEKGSNGLSGEFMTPNGTTGTLVLPAPQGNVSLVLSGPDGNSTLSAVENGVVTATGLRGGSYIVKFG